MYCRCAILLGEIVTPCFVRNQAELASVRSEPAIGVVDSELQAKLRSRSEHPVRLVRAFANQVVDENRSVAFRAVEDEWFLTLNFQGGIDAGHDSLTRRFFIAGRAVDLSGQKQPQDLLRLQRALQFGGIDRVVLDCISRTQHLRRFQSGNGLDYGELHVDWHRRGHAVYINLMRVQPLRLEEELVL